MEKHKVLVVDDEPDFLKIISYRLEKADYEVITASDGKGCIEQIKKFSPDIIIMDIMMPELDGIATVLKLKSLKEASSIPIIVCTAVKEADDEIVAQNLGVADYIRKSPQAEDLTEDLIAKIERVLKK